MKIWILSLFPEYFHPFLKYGISAQALSGKRGKDFQVHLIQIRDYANDKYRSVDDSPYGGGPGMVMRADVLERALLKGVVKHYGDDFKKMAKVICPNPQGRLWNDAKARKFAAEFLNGDGDLVFICGRYEGIDQRFIDLYVDEQISLGDFVLTGGELAAMAVLDSALRFVPTVLGNKESSKQDSFGDNCLEGPLYTRPSDFHGKKVPKILLSGHHQKIACYQREASRKITEELRPDLQNGRIQ